MTQLAPLFEGTARDTTEENLQARCRGVLLMALSNKRRRIVLTTGNKSEMAVGYATLYGDMAGGFDVLKDVPKTLVFKLCEYRNSVDYVIPQRVIDRPPSAELAPDQVDQDSLPRTTSWMPSSSVMWKRMRPWPTWWQKVSRKRWCAR